MLWVTVLSLLNYFTFLGYAATTAAGRCVVKYFDKSRADRVKVKGRPGGGDFTFQCHRNKVEKAIYAVNDVKFHPVTGTICTAGSDGTYAIWDKDNRSRV